MSRACDIQTVSEVAWHGMAWHTGSRACIPNWSPGCKASKEKGGGMEQTIDIRNMNREHCLYEHWAHSEWKYVRMPRTKDSIGLIEKTA